MAFLPSLLRNRRGQAAAEMALLTPMLIALMFGAMELGNYFYNEHKVVKAVRDAARYAARLPFDKYTCSTLDAGLETQVKNLTRTGQLSGGTGIIGGWTTDNHITVAVSCNAGFDTGIYNGMDAGAPVVTVSVSDLHYPSLFQALGFDASLVTLNASSTAAVTGA